MLRPYGSREASFRSLRLICEAKSMVRRLPASAQSQRSELSSPGRLADLYSAFGVQRNLGDLREKRPGRVFSATDSSRDNPKNAAKCDVLGVGTRYVSDNEDLLAEGEGFEPPVPFRVQRFSRPPVSTAHTSLRELKRRQPPLWHGFARAVVSGGLGVRDSR